MFFNCSALTSLDLSNFKTKKVFDMSFMFKYCTSLNSLNISKFNCESIVDCSKDLLEMFNNCNMTKDKIKCKDVKILNQLDIDLKKN